jgi:CRISPR-associated protein Csm1
MAVYEEIVLASWLHDIAKFAHRAGIKGSVEELLQSIEEYLPKETDKGVNIQTAEVIRLAGACHNPSSYDEWLIAHGNRLSGGADQDAEQNSETKFNEQPLVNIISTLQIGKRAAPNRAYYQLKPMEDEAILAAANPKAGKPEYLSLWQDFERDFRTLKGLKYQNFMLSFDTLMERYCWCIPAAEGEDLSLYQHSKLSAAFAGALYLYHKEKKTETKTALDQNDEQAFLFIQGDMSGIQKYIFDLKTTENSSKLLRARSFQIWALAEIIAEYLMGQFGVFHENIVTSAGGKFLLLVPNSSELKGKLPDLKLKLEKFFLKEFAGKLSFILSDGVAASALDLQKENMQKLLNKIRINGIEAKQKKMQRALGNNGPEPALLTELYALLQKNRECDWCETLPADPEANGKNICGNCADLIDIGGKLIRTNKIEFNTDKLIHFGEMVSLLQKNDSRFGYLTNYEPGSPFMALPYWAPVKDEAHNELFTFDELADKSRGGYKKLAMFKADIDNLGLVFSSAWGKAENRISFSRYAQLSRHLHYFSQAMFLVL